MEIIYSDKTYVKLASLDQASLQIMVLITPKRKNTTQGVWKFVEEFPQIDLVFEGAQHNRYLTKRYLQTFTSIGYYTEEITIPESIYTTAFREVRYPVVYRWR